MQAWPVVLFTVLTVGIMWGCSPREDVMWVGSGSVGAGGGGGDPDPTSGASSSSSSSGMGAGSGGASSSSSSSASGGGGAPTCYDQIEIGPKHVYLWAHRVLALGLGATDGRFGLVIMQEVPVYENEVAITQHVVTFDPVETETSYPLFLSGLTPDNTGHLGVASRPNGFAVVEMEGPTINIHRIGALGEDQGRTDSAYYLGNSGRVIGSRAADGVLLAHRDLSGSLHTSFFAEGANVPSNHQNVGLVWGNDDRFYSGVETTSGFGLIWNETSSQTNFATFDATGQFTGLFEYGDLLPTTPGIAHGLSAARLDTGPELVVVSRTGYASLSETGVVNSNGTFDTEGFRTIASTGSRLRVAAIANNNLEWRAFDPVDGPGGLMHSFSVWSAEAEVLPAVAWDGTGFGVVWAEGNEIAFAYLRPCLD